MIAVDHQRSGARHDATVGAAVLAVVRELEEELRGAEARTDVTLDSRLEDDLGLYSLERLELILRIERRAGVRLSDDAIANAESVDDLVRAIGGHPANIAARRARTSGRGPRHQISAPPPSATFTGYMAVLLFFCVPALWLLLKIGSQGGPARRLLRRTARAIISASRCPIEVDGLEHLTGAGPVVLMANHQSYLDAFVLIAVLPVDMTIVVNEKLPRLPFLGTAIRAARHLVVNRRAGAPREGVEAMADALGGGDVLLVFPEGTTARTTRMLPLRLGGFAAALQSRRPIVPVTVAGTHQILPVGRWTLGRGPVSVSVHPAVYPVGEGWAELLRLRREVTARLAAV